MPLDGEGGRWCLRWHSNSVQQANFSCGRLFDHADDFGLTCQQLQLEKSSMHSPHSLLHFKLIPCRQLASISTVCSPTRAVNQSISSSDPEQLSSLQPWVSSTERVLWSRKCWWHSFWLASSPSLWPCEPHAAHAYVLTCCCCSLFKPCGCLPIPPAPLTTATETVTVT